MGQEGVGGEEGRIGNEARLCVRGRDARHWSPESHVMLQMGTGALLLLCMTGRSFPLLIACLHHTNSRPVGLGNASCFHVRTSTASNGKNYPPPPQPHYHLTTTTTITTTTFPYSVRDARWQQLKDSRFSHETFRS